MQRIAITEDVDVPAPTPRLTLARVSLMFGLLDCVVLPVVGQWVAIITGHWARAQIRRRHAPMDTDAFALAGLTLGWIGLIVLMVVAAVMVFRVIPALKALGQVLLDAPLLRSH
jgi:hypothetical protein